LLLGFIHLTLIIKDGAQPSVKRLQGRNTHVTFS
jgi:hypothetical protein